MARTLTLLPVLLLEPVNDHADPAKDGDWQLYQRNNQHPNPIPPPPKPDELRLAELERALAAQTLTAAEETELIYLLAKVKGIRIQQVDQMQLPGSGPHPGVIEVSARAKSIKAFQNFKPNAPVDFVYDPTTGRLVIATSRTAYSGHSGLVKSLGAVERHIVGGRLRRGPNGEFETSEWSGHYGDQWTPAIRSQFKAFMLQQTGKPVNHSDSMYFSDGTN